MGLDTVLFLLVALLISSATADVLVRTAARHGRFSHDSDLSGPQKFHARSVPRVGGVALMLGWLVAGLLLWVLEPSSGRTALMLTLSSVPTFVAGLTEDLTKRVSPRGRFAATALSAALAVWLIGGPIVRTDLPLLDDIVVHPLGALLVTMFVVTGVANSFNIIDGFNGLASMCGMLILTAVACVAFRVGDHTVMLLALLAIGAVFGFFVWNFPGGRIFLGDGGAYLLGFFVAELSILLLHRNAAVSPMFPLLACIYPVFETVFSMYRRRVLQAAPSSAPDGIHLHSLIYRRPLRLARVDDGVDEPVRRNSMTSPYLWALCLLSLVPAVLWWDSSWKLGACIVVFGFVYSWLYWRIVRFRSPRWLFAASRWPAPRVREVGGAAARRPTVADNDPR